MSDVTKGPALIDLTAAHEEEDERKILHYPDLQVPTLSRYLVTMHVSFFLCCTDVPSSSLVAHHGLYLQVPSLETIVMCRAWQFCQ